MDLLDTNHCSLILEGDPQVRERLLQKGSVLVATSVIVRGELRFMAAHSARKTENLARVEAFLQRIHLFPIDEATADLYGDLKAAIYARFGPKERSKRRRTRIEHLGVHENDLWIAATAIQHGLTVISADQDFERISEVMHFPLERWRSLPSASREGE